MFKTMKSRLIAVVLALAIVGSFAAVRLGTIGRVFALTPSEGSEVGSGVQTNESITGTEITTQSQEESVENADTQRNESQSNSEDATQTSNTDDRSNKNKENKEENSNSDESHISSSDTK
jgi:hypothetical protein